MLRIFNVIRNEAYGKILNIGINHNLFMAKMHVPDETDIAFKKYAGRALKSEKKAAQLTADNTKILHEMSKKELCGLVFVKDTLNVLAIAGLIDVVLQIIVKGVNKDG